MYFLYSFPLWFIGDGLVAKLGATLATPQTVAHQAPLSMDFPGKNTGVVCHFLFQGIFPTQGFNLCLLHCRRIITEPPGKPMVYYRILTIVPCAIQLDFIVYPFCSNTLHLLISNSQSNPPPPPFPLGQLQVCSLCLRVCFSFVCTFICAIF